MLPGEELLFSIEVILFLVCCLSISCV